MIAASIYNRWVQQSFARLASLVPGRYAKEEHSMGFLGAIESFTYRQPSYVEPVVTEALATETEVRRARSTERHSQWRRLNRYRTERECGR
jgi:hypothetical protein